jgi:enolase
MLNVINGGAHAANSIDLQSSWSCRSTRDSFADALRIGAEVYHALKQVLGDRGLATGVGDEGGFAPDLESSEAAIEAIPRGRGAGGHRERIAIALDPATSESSPRAAIASKGAIFRLPSCPRSGEGGRMRYPVVSIEDGCAEDDWEAGPL